MGIKHTLTMVSYVETLKQDIVRWLKQYVSKMMVLTCLESIFCLISKTVLHVLFPHTKLLTKYSMYFIHSC